VIFKLCPTLASFFILMEGTRNSGAGNVSNKTFKIDLKFETVTSGTTTTAKISIFTCVCSSKFWIGWRFKPTIARPNVIKPFLVDFTKLN
jgi:hypothetical protein